MEDKLRDLLVGAGIGDIVLSRKKFIKEHKNLLGVLKKGKRSELDAEYADQAAELFKELKGGMLGMFGKKKEKEEESVVSSNPAAGLRATEAADPTAFKNPMKAAQKLSVFDNPEAMARARSGLMKIINKHPIYKDIAEETKAQAIEEELENYRGSLLATLDIDKDSDRLKNFMGVLKRLTGKGRLHGGFNEDWKREVSDELTVLIFTKGWELPRVKQWLEEKFNFDPEKVEDVIRIHLPEVWALFPEPEPEPAAKRHKAGSRNSGFIARMMGEVKAVHKGAYKPITALAKNSSMSAPRVFDYGKMKKPSGWLQTKFGKAKAPVETGTVVESGFRKPDMALLGKYHSALKSGKNKPQVAQFEDLYHDWLVLNDAEYKKKYQGSEAFKQVKARQDQRHKEERYIQPFKKTIENVKYYSKPENWQRMMTKDRAALYSDIDSLDYIQKQVPEVGANPYPNADSLPYVEMRRAYKMWLNKKAKK